MSREHPLHLVQITPGAGNMYCGACMRDNALVNALRHQGHQAVMVPLYLPLTLDERDESAGAPVFYGGISVYLEQQSAVFQRQPEWLRRMLASPALLKRAAGAAAQTRPDTLGPLTISMLRGEDGRQAAELDHLIDWLRAEKPDVAGLSNALLAGLARRIRAELRIPVVCSLQGEDWFLDSLPEPDRQLAWQVASERAGDIDLFIAPSRYYGDLMQRRLGIPPQKMRVLFNGLNLEGYGPAAAPAPGQPPVLGFFARMGREKGLEIVVRAFVLLRKRGRVGNLKLRVGGSCGPADQAVVDEMRALLAENQLQNEAEFCPNLTRAEKQDFLRSLSVFSVPAPYGEAFGLYLIEALACAVPVVQPRQAAYPELIAATGGGVLFEPNDPEALAGAVESLLADPVRARALGEAGRKSVTEKFGIADMAARMAAICREATAGFHS